MLENEKLVMFGPIFIGTTLMNTLLSYHELKWYQGHPQITFKDARRKDLPLRTRLPSAEMKKNSGNSSFVCDLFLLIDPMIFCFIKILVRTRISEKHLLFTTRQMFINVPCNWVSFNSFLFFLYQHQETI